MQYRVHNGNADETVEAENGMEALNKFVELHPDQIHNAAFINPVTESERRNVFDKEGEDGVPPVHS